LLKLLKSILLKAVGVGAAKPPESGVETVCEIVCAVFPKANTAGAAGAEEMGVPVSGLMSKAGADVAPPKENAVEGDDCAAEDAVNAGREGIALDVPGKLKEVEEEVAEDG